MIGVKTTWKRLTILSLVRIVQVDSERRGKKNSHQVDNDYSADGLLSTVQQCQYQWSKWASCLFVFAIIQGTGLSSHVKGCGTKRVNDICIVYVDESSEWQRKGEEQTLLIDIWWFTIPVTVYGVRGSDTVYLDEHTVADNECERAERSGFGVGHCCCWLCEKMNENGWENLKVCIWKNIL